MHSLSNPKKNSSKKFEESTLLSFKRNKGMFDETGKDSIFNIKDISKESFIGFKNSLPPIKGKICDIFTTS